MNPFSLATTPDELRPDVVIDRPGVRFRASFFKYADELGLDAPKAGDQYRLLIDVDNQRLGFRKATKSKSGGRGLLVSPRSINNCKIYAEVEEALGSAWRYPSLSLVSRGPGEEVDFCLQRYEVVQDRVRKLYEDLPNHLQRFGFRQCDSGQFLGEDHTLLLGGGKLTAMRNGNEVSSITICVPFVKAEDIDTFLQGLVVSGVDPRKRSFS